MDWKEKFLNRIIEGDSELLLKEIPPDQINLVITSPPYYKQRDYGSFQNEIGNEETVEGYVDHLWKVFHECVRVTHPTGNIVYNIGDKYEDRSLQLVPYRFALEVLEREPIKLVNNVIWVKTNPTPRQYKRRLVSSTEPFFHFVKSDEYYYDIESFMKPKKTKKKTNENSDVGRGYFELIEQSQLSPKEKEKAKEELSKVIQEVREGKIDGLRMKIRGVHAPAFGGQEGGRQIQMEKQGFTIIKLHGKKMRRDVIHCSVETIGNRKHPSIYPEFIIQEFIKLLTKPNDIVLDPFVGSGTTCVAAKKLGRRFIGIDVNPEYCQYARQRIGNVKQHVLDQFVR